MQYKNLKFIFYVIFTTLFFSNVMAKGKFTFSTGATYITGDYGNEKKTEIYFVPLSFKYKVDKFKFKLTLPYLEKIGPKNVIVDLGQLGQSRKTIRTTESGIGDITASVRYNFYYNPRYKFLMNAEGKIKFGTAEEQKGLGTGKTDYSLRIGFFKVFDKITPYTRVGYKVFGSRQLNDAFFVSTGLSYKVNSSVSAGFDFLWREKVSDSGEEKRRLTGFSTQKLTKNWGLQEYIIKGFGRSTADWGGGISINYSFGL